MPRTNGVFSLVPSYRAVSGQTIRSEQHNPPLEDIASALTNSLPRDGSAPMTSSLSMGNNRITNLKAGTAASDAVRRDQVTLYSAYLESVSALALEPNRLPYATGAGSSAAAVFTAFGRSLLADANASEGRATLGLGNAATFDIANLSEAQAGTSDSAIMSPFRVAQYVATQAVGVGQAWQDVSGSRSTGTSYRNTTGRPIMVAVDAGETQLQVSTNNSTWVVIQNNINFGVQAIIPSGHYYRVIGGAIEVWAELR